MGLGLQTTYSNQSLERIADAIGCDAGEVKDQVGRFEAAAAWYRLDKRAPTRVTPSALKRKLKTVSSQAQRLLKSLGIGDAERAMDGPEDPAIVAALELSRHERDRLTRAGEQLARMALMLEGIQAIVEVGRFGQEAGRVAPEAVRKIVHRGHRGDDPLNNWIEAMLVLYETLTGKGPQTSIAAPGRPDRGEAGGPLIRFLQTAGEPLGLLKSPHSWRERIRLLERGARLQN